MNRALYLVLLLLAVAGCRKDGVDFSVPEPEFFTSDIDLFWQVYDQATPTFSTQDFRQAYINRGTDGLRDYAEQKDLAPSLKGLLQLDEYVTYYNGVRSNTTDLADVIATSKQGFDLLEQIYPETQFFNVYFLIGAMSAGGRVSENGLLIAAEMFTKNENTSLDDLNEWHQAVLRNKEFLPSIVLHEFVHKQQQFIAQNSGARTALEQSIVEGMADFVAKYLIGTGPFVNVHLHTYGDLIEEALWTEFEPDMYSRYQNTEWLYTGSTTSQGHPADMGYYIGFKILESYAQTFDNVEMAIATMLNADDYVEIFERSGYAGKFN